MKWKRLVAGSLILVVVAGGVVWWRKQAAAKKAAAAEPEIETATVERKDLNVTVAASGVLEALTTVEVKSRSGGEVIKLFVEAGDAVKAGQLIAQIDPTNLRNRAQQASSSVTSARAQTTMAKVQADLQIAQTTGDLDRASAGVATGRAGVTQAEEQLRQEKETSAGNLQQATAGLGAAKARLAQAEAQHKVQPALTNAEIESSQAALNSAQHNLARVKAGARPQEIAQSAAALRSADSAARTADLSLQRQEALLAQGYAAKQSVDDARKARDQAIAGRDQAQEALDLLKAGNRAEDIAQAEAQVTQAEASLRLAKANQVQVDLKQSDVTAAREAVVQAEAGVTSAKAQQRNILVRGKQLESAQAALRQAEATLRTARAGKLADQAKREQIQVAASQLRNAGLELDQALYDLRYTNVYAPRTGVVMQKLVEEGTVIPPGTAALKEGAGLVTIADTSQMFMLADVDESDMAGVRAGQKCEVAAAVLPDQKMQGEVVRIFPQGKEENNVVRFQVRIKILRPVPALRPGMTGDVTVQVAFRKSVLVIPDTCISRAKGKETVEVQAAAEKSETRPIKAGLSNWDETEIVSGLEVGEKVIVPPPPGTELPSWMGGGAKKGEKGKKEASDQTRRRMMMQLKMRGK